MSSLSIGCTVYLQRSNPFREVYNCFWMHETQYFHSIYKYIIQYCFLLCHIPIWHCTISIMPPDSYKSESFKQIRKINANTRFLGIQIVKQVSFDHFALQQRSKNQTGIKMAKYARNCYSQWHGYIECSILCLFFPFAELRDKSTCFLQGHQTA